MSKPDNLIRTVINTKFKWYKSVGAEFDDLYQTGYIGYLKAQQRFKDSEFDELCDTYAFTYIFREIYDYMGKQFQIKNLEVYGVDRFMHLLEEDLADSGRQEHLLFAIRELTNELPSIEFTVIQRLFLDDTTISQSELADQLGVSKQYISQVKQSALKKLQKWSSNEKKK